MVSDPPLPSLSAIRAFEAAARLGSFAQAARELGTTAASVSYHVRRLEQQIGAQLFVRHPHRVELTRAGAPIAREASRAFAALRASFSRAIDADETQLRLTTVPTFGASWLTPRLGRFRARHPEIAVELDLSATAHDLGAGAFDLAIRNGHGDWPGLRSVKLLPSLFTPLCAPALKEQAAGLGEPRRPLEVQLLGRPDWWTLWFRALGYPELPRPNSFGTRLAQEHLDVAAALAGHGVAIASPLLFHDEIEAGRLVCAHDLVAADGRAFWLAWPVARQPSRKVVKFRDWIREEAARALDASDRFTRSAIVVQP